MSPEAAPSQERTPAASTESRGACAACPDCRDRRLGRDLRAGEGRRRALSALSVPAAPRVRSLGHEGRTRGAFLGLLLGAGYGLQTAGLERTTVSSTGFITGMYVVLTPLIALALFGARIGAWAWTGVAVSTIGLAMLSGIHAGSVGGDLLVLAAA